jgi:hypothetical protein
VGADGVGAVEVELVVEVEEVEVDVVVGSDEDDSVLEVRTAGSGIVVMPSFGSCLSWGREVEVGSDAGPSSLPGPAGVGVGSGLTKLETKLSRGSRRFCRLSKGLA